MTVVHRGAGEAGVIPDELDGRRRRSAQSREAIASAMFELVGEGDLRPSAQRVADRARVGIRTVFRHFDEMDRLYEEMHARLRSKVRPLLAERTPRGPLPRRARDLVAMRCDLYEQLGPYKRAANLHRRSSDYLQRRHQVMVRDLRADLERWLPELAGVATPLSNAIEVAVSFESWDRLRSDQKLSQKDTRASMETTVDALVASLPRARA